MAYDRWLGDLLNEAVAAEQEGEAAIGRIHRRRVRQVAEPLDGVEHRRVRGLDDVDPAGRPLDDQPQIPGAAQFVGECRGYQEARESDGERR